MLLPASALQPISTNGTLAAKPCRVAYKKDIPYLKRRAQQREGKFVTRKHGKPYKWTEARIWSTDVFFSDSRFGASGCLSQFQAYCCSRIKRKCGLIIAGKEERHGLDLNKSNLANNSVWKNKSRSAWPSQFVVQAHGLEQQPIPGMQPIHNQGATKFQNRTVSI